LRGHEITEFVRWQRVRPILYALLLVLFMLLSFRYLGPMFVANVGNSIETITASPKLGSWIEEVKKNYQFFVFLFSTFVICMGLTRWLGKRQWYQERISRRKKLKLPVASLFSADSSSFSYSGLFQGGLIGLAVVSWHFMILVGYPSGGKDVSNRLPLQMLTPIAAIGQMSLGMFWVSLFSRQHRDMLINSLGLIMSSTVLNVILVSTLVVSFTMLGDENVGFTGPIILTVIVSLCYSYSRGVSEGVKAADPESTYPVVSVKVIEGTDFEEAWLYERTDSDYRIVTKSGSNHIIPASNVKEIKGL